MARPIWMNFFVFFVSLEAIFLPNGVRKFHDLQGHLSRKNLLWPIAAKRSEIRKWFAWTGIQKVYAANRTHQADLTYDDPEGQCQGQLQGREVCLFKHYCGLIFFIYFYPSF